MTWRLFGTDGIRGVAGEFPLDARTVYAVGKALGGMAARGTRSPEVLIGIDTRESGPWLGACLAAGLRDGGAEPRFAGVITTPGVAYLTRVNAFVAGVMISASHNPYQDNGLKIFSHSGYKLAGQQEAELEQDIFSLLQTGTIESRAEELSPDPRFAEQYLRFLEGSFSGRLDGVRITLDCANGAASRLGPELFRRLGASVEAMACAPDGRNINLDCGALHVDALRGRVAAEGGGLGLALDGDADRAILVSSGGKVVDGDGILLLAARWLAARGELSDRGGTPTVVATVMSNLGLERALERRGIRMLRTAVGDRSVLEEMLRTGAVLGGEQSGHIIFHNYATSGDGLLTALRVLEVARAEGAGLDELTRELVRYPQQLVNVRVRRRPPLEELPEVSSEMRRAEEDFAGSGRILVRYSGTELLARVMVEGADGERVQLHARRIADAIRRAIGAEGS